VNETELDLLFLEALWACGVDNWDGYGEAIDLYNEWLGEENGC